MLKEYLAGKIQVVNHITHWQKAIKIAAEPLLTDGIIDKNYIDLMIENIDVNGPYMIVKDYVALPHAEAGIGVEEIGISLLITKEPVDLKGNDIKIWLVLAATDSESHLDLLKELSKVLIDEEKYNTLLNGNKTEVLQIFE